MIDMRRVVLLVFMLVFAGKLSFAESEPTPDYPAIMVIMDSCIDGVKASEPIAAAEIGRIFRENGFPVVKINETDSKDFLPVYTAPPEKTAVLGRKYGADAIIAGKARSDIVKTDVPYGTAVYTYQARIEARIVKADTGRVVSMDKVVYVARDPEKARAKESALLGAAGNISQSLIQKVSAIWRKEVYREITVTLVCENAARPKAELLKRALEFTRGVTAFKERSFKRDKLELEIRFSGTSEQLTSLLRQFVEPVFEVTGSAPDKINIRFIKKNKDFTSDKLRF